MPSLKDIRTRIESTKNTQQITRAMKMVSAAKLRRAQQNIVNLRPYATTMLGVIADIAATHRVEHPLLSRTLDPKKILMVVINSDRGLCGAFNTNINRFAEKYLQENKSRFEKIDFLFIGKKASEYFRRRQIIGVDTILNMAKEISHAMAANVAERVMQSYKSGEYDEVHFVYNQFKSAISQVVTDEIILPLDITASSTLAAPNSDFPKDMIFEPPPEMIIDELLQKHFAVQVYRCLSESVASEHGARMSSMENATKNAGQMISSLTLTYNKLRQASITTELIEITSGAEALKG